MTRADLLALAERAERAEGADRELDAAIALACGWKKDPATTTGWYSPEAVSASKREKRALWKYPRGPLPAFTASLDAALSLVPDGWAWSMKSKMEGAEYACGCWGYQTGIGPTVYAATPALALTAAALRARAAEEGEP